MTYTMTGSHLEVMQMGITNGGSLEVLLSARTIHSQFQIPHGVIQ